MSTLAARSNAQSIASLQDTPVGRVRAIGIITAMGLAAVDAWAGRHAMTHDGISYLDMSDGVLQGNWAGAVNGHWSPLYPWLLAAARWIVGTDPQWEFPLVHAVNLLLFLGTLAAFDFLLREVLRSRVDAGRSGAPAWVVATVGYVIFLWSSLNLIGTGFVAPDFAVAACAYLAAGLVLRCRREPAPLMSWAALGLALGLGYLAKAPMFPLGMVFLVLAVVPRPRTIVLPHLLSRAGLALAVFLLVAAVHVAGLYATKGRLTLGDSAWLNYLWHVNRVGVLHYQGGRPDLGTPRNPTRMIADDPAAYEFAGPVVATYPPWFDPAYWYRGLRPRPDPKGHLITAKWSLRLYGTEHALRHWLPSGMALIFVGAYLTRRRWWSVEALVRHTVLWTAGAAALTMYAVIHLESRYIAPFVTLLWLGAVTGVRLPPGRQVIRSASIVLVAVLMVHAALVVVVTARGARAIRRESIAHRSSRPVDVHWRVAQALRQMDMQPGDRVAVIGPGIRAYWARLGRLRIVAEVPAWEEGEFWTAEARTRQAILDRFAAVGAKIVVHEISARPEARRVTIDYDAMGWQRIGGTDYYARILGK
ncbi:MAG: hypothetical protein ACT4PY_07060 [Armatimonadota bacterium]